MKSLRVDVILESEQRSTSPVNLKFIGQIVGGLVLVLLIGGVSYYVLGARSVKQQLDALTEEWGKTSKVLDRVRQDQKDLRWLTDIYTEIDGWEKARVLWHQHLADFQALVPPNIQITSFSADDQIPMIGRTPQGQITGTTRSTLVLFVQENTIFRSGHSMARNIPTRSR